MCLRWSPGLFRHGGGAASCHTSSMAAKPHLALTKNSSPTTLANGRRATQIAESRGSAPGRASQGAKYPPAAAGEIPAGRSQRNSPSSQTAIRRWRNPRLLPRQQPWTGAPACGRGAAVHPAHRANTIPRTGGGGKPPPYRSERIGYPMDFGAYRGECVPVTGRNVSARFIHPPTLRR